MKKTGLKRASSFRRRSGSSNTAADYDSSTNSSTVIIIPSYPADNYVKRRHVIFCAILAAVLSYSGLNNNLFVLTGGSHPSSDAISSSSSSSILSSGAGLFSFSSSDGVGVFTGSRSSIHGGGSSSSSIVENQRSHEDYFLQARTFLNANEPRMALEELLEADKIYPDDIELKLYLGSTYTLLIQYDKAIDAYQQALDLIERNEPTTDKVYKQRALTMKGVLHRGRGRIDKAIEWLEASVAHNENDRENRNYLAQCYFLKGRVLDASQHLIEIIRRDIAADDDYRLLSYALSAMEEWQLLAGMLQQCLYYGFCTLSRDSEYSTDQILLEYAVALDKLGQSDAAVQKLQEAARIASTKKQKQTVQQIRQRTQAYIQEAQEGTKKALAWNDQQPGGVVFQEESKKRWEALAKVLQTSMRIGLTAWSTYFERHVNGFRWPVPGVLGDLLIKEIKEDKASVSENSIAPLLLSHRTTEIVSRSACQAINIYSFSDCIFYAKVNGARLQHRLRTENKVSVKTYHDFEQATYRPLQHKSDVLHVGVFSDLKYPMLNLVWEFIRNTHGNENKSVRVTLYHPPDVASIILDHILPKVSNSVECTKETWADCVEHARRNKVQVWLETSLDAVEGIPHMIASGPAPVGISWGGLLPGTLGMPSTLQYMVTDRYSVPPDSTVSAEYPEKIIYVPGTWVLLEAEPPRFGNMTLEHVQTQYDIPPHAVIYCYFGRLSKITDDVFKVWSDIVSKVPGSVLLLSNWHSPDNPLPRMRKAWTDRGLAADRLIVLPFFSFDDHLCVLSALSDGHTIALDSMAYSSAMTSYNAIQAGFPLIHCSPSWKIAQRMGGSVLTAAGLGDYLLASTAREYEDLGVLLGTSVTVYQQVKNKTLEARKEAPLFMNRYGIACMVSGMRKAYKIWYEGRKPQTIFTEDKQQIQQLHESSSGQNNNNNNSGSNDTEAAEQLGNNSTEPQMMQANSTSTSTS